MQRIAHSQVATIDPVVLYEILRLRSAAFVVEQDCVYLDLDGRDLEPEAVLFWLSDESGITATLRVLQDADAWRVGRVVCAPRGRGTGAAKALMHAALATIHGSAILDAQTPLVPWYAAFGFEPSGPEFLEDDIPHTPMRTVLP